MFRIIVEFNKDLSKEINSIAELIGTGNKLFHVLKLASKVSDTDASVLVLGKTVPEKNY